MHTRLYLAALFGSLLLASCSSDSETPSENSVQEAIHQQYDLSLSEELAVFAPLPDQADNPDNPTEVNKSLLGQALYFDKRLSKDGNISCNSCHNLATGGVDNLPTSPGDAGENGDRNSPTVLNAALHFAQFWDGRAKDVEEQAGMPILNPVEMAIPNEEFLVNRLKEIPDYQVMFSAAFPNDDDPITYTNLRLAIADFERQLLTPSRFDDYLKGDKSALTVQEKRGLQTFISSNCTQCHTGVLLGGHKFEKFGVYGDYWKWTGSENQDPGLFEETQDSLDLYRFKVPSLRNITETGPYFHDGSVADLRMAVTIMAEAQLNRQLKPNEVEDIVAFLGALSGEIPAWAQQPAP
ncbi:cytochrome-c peroxidase [bacterium SCSIO 12741]|nr:cytochrome-c peroxidase [bacterium SCSIO 12741]